MASILIGGLPCCFCRACCILVQMFVKQLFLVQHSCLPSLRSRQSHSECLGLGRCTVDVRHLRERQRLLYDCPGIARATPELTTTSNTEQAELNGAVAAPGVALEVSHVSMAFGNHQVRLHSCCASESHHMIIAAHRLLQTFGMGCKSISGDCRCFPMSAWRFPEGPSTCWWARTAVESPHFSGF